MRLKIALVDVALYGIGQSLENGSSAVGGQRRLGDVTLAKNVAKANGSSRRPAALPQLACFYQPLDRTGLDLR